ncbi:MAG TPA: hypothetical protein VF199_06190 [Bacillales bacterium]
MADIFFLMIMFAFGIILAVLGIGSIVIRKVNEPKEDMENRIAILEKKIKDIKNDK